MTDRLVYYWIEISLRQFYVVWNLRFFYMKSAITEGFFSGKWCIKLERSSKNEFLRGFN
jgi:hypothetical protein